jgi:hypothetical protein
VSGDEEALGIAAEARGMPVHPGDRGAALAHQFVHVDGGDERVVDDHGGRARGTEGARDEAEVGLVERAPIAAVDEHLDRRGAGPRREEDVERLRGRRPVGEVEPAREIPPRRGALAGIAGEVRRGVGHLAAVVVFPIERSLIVIPEDARVRAHDQSGAGATARSGNGGSAEGTAPDAVSSSAYAVAARR